MYVTTISLFELFVKFPARVKGNEWFKMSVEADPPKDASSVDVTIRSKRRSAGMEGIVGELISKLVFPPSQIFGLRLFNTPLGVGSTTTVV